MNEIRIDPKKIKEILRQQLKAQSDGKLAKLQGNLPKRKKNTSAGFRAR